MDKSHLLEKQVQQLIKTASDPQSQFAVQIAGSVLKAIAQKLAHTHYWLVTSKEGYWQSVHLSNLHAPEQEKTVIYAFVDLTGANTERVQSQQSDRLACAEVPVIEILFRLLGLQSVDSVVFFDQPFSTDKGTEITRTSLEKICREQIEKYPTQIA